MGRSGKDPVGKAPRGRGGAARWYALVLIAIAVVLAIRAVQSVEERGRSVVAREGAGVEDAAGSTAPGEADAGGSGTDRPPDGGRESLVPDVPRLRGVVLDPALRPLADARITVLPTRAPGRDPGRDPAIEDRTERNGRFDLVLPCAAPWSMRVAREGYVDWSSAALKAPRELTIVLHPVRPLTIRVADGDGHPIEGAHVRVSSPGLRSPGGEPGITPRQEGESDARGLCVFPVAGFGRVHVFGWHAGYRHPGNALEVDIAPEGAVEAELVLVRGRALRGSVRDAITGAPLVGATVDTSPLFRAAPCATDGDGRFEMPGGPEPDAGASLFARAPGFALGCVPVTRETDYDIRLEPGVTVTCRIVDPRGVPVRGARVELIAGQTGPATEFLETASDAQGTARIDGVRPDLRHALRVSRTGHARVFFDLEDFPPGDAEVDLGDVVLPESRAIRGRVLHADGTPAAGLRLALDLEKPRDTLAGRGEWPVHLRYSDPDGIVTDEFGGFEFAGLDRGSYRVSVPGTRVTAGARVDAADVELVIRLPWSRTVTVLLLPTSFAEAGGVTVTALGPGTNVTAWYEPLLGGVTLRLKGTDRIASLLVRREVPGGASAEQRFDAIDDSRDVHVLHLGETRTVEGCVKDSSGAPVPGACVRWSVDQREPRTMRADDRGEFTLAVSSGRVLAVWWTGVRSPADGRETWMPEFARVELSAAGGGGRIELRGESTEDRPGIEVVVLRSDGTPAAGARVVVSTTGGRIHLAGEAGLARIPSLAPVQSSVWAFDGRAWSPPVALVPGGQRVTLVLTAPP